MGLTFKDLDELLDLMEERLPTKEGVTSITVQSDESLKTRLFGLKYGDRVPEMKSATDERFLYAGIPVFMNPFIPGDKAAVTFGAGEVILLPIRRFLRALQEER